jgi:hypothetical protein
VKSKSSIRAFWLCASLALLAGAAMQARSFVAPTEATGYHARVRAVAAAASMNIGAWTGQDVDVPYDAINMLQPNVLISRKYQSGDRHVWFQLVQCQDVRSLEEHYPPNCYTAIGYSKISAAPRDWNIRGETIKGTEYVFARVAVDSSTSIVVENFMVLPGEGTVRDMEPVTRAAEDVRRRKYGAAEFQVLFEPGTNATERSQIVEQILAPYGPVISAIEAPTEEGKERELK